MELSPVFEASEKEAYPKPWLRASRWKMRFVRSTCLLGLFTLLVATVPPSCNTKAVGIDECRDIEYARCEVGIYCKSDFDIDDVSACKRYYRDQCLRGLPVPEIPGKPEVNECIDRIRQLGSCAKKSGEDALVSDCADSTSTRATVNTVCALLKQPQFSPECAFLVEDSSEGSGSGGAGGEGGGGKGAGGLAGSAGNSGSSGEAGTSGTANGGSGGSS